MITIPAQTGTGTAPSQDVRPALDLGPDALCECTHPLAPCGEPRRWMRIQTCRCQNRRGYCQGCHDIIARVAALALAVDPRAVALCVACMDPYFVADLTWAAI